MKSSMMALLALAVVHLPRNSAAQIIDAGSDLPTVGRSLFDTLIGNADGYAIPYPFEQLIALLRERAGCKPMTCTRQVLVPLGRSLQRPAAIGEYFRYPRVITAFDAEPEHGAPHLPLLRDRLYLGYQEKSNTIEVISYNEAAGRFEFQLITDYTALTQAKLRYAQRGMCASCHQGLSPIFSRPLWQETNANPAIAQRLRRYPAGLHGVRPQVSVDEPNAIDNATDRANRFGTAQAIWQTGCGDDATPQARSCRASLLTAALQYRLSTGHGYSASAVAAARDTLVSRWQTTWPQGLALPDDDIPNRTPDLTYSEGRQARRASYIAAAFEPLVLRKPREVWREFALDQQDGLIADLASFFTRSDIQLLDSALRRNDHPARRHSVLDCAGFEPPRDEQQRLVFQCGDNVGSYVAGYAYLNRMHDGVIEVTRVQADRQVAGDGFSGNATLTLDRRATATSAMFKVTRDALTVRSRDGHALDGIELNWSVTGHARLTLRISNDAQPLWQAIAALQLHATDDALAARPFRRTAIMSAVTRQLKQATQLSWSSSTCCSRDVILPTPVSDSSKTNTTTNRLINNLQTWCGSCHASGEKFPPSFLSGTDDEVASKLRQCASRIFQRLSMWQIPVSGRNKTPMPPAAALADVTLERQQTIYRREFAALATLVRPLLGITNTVVLAASDGDAYELLPPCLTAYGYSNPSTHDEVASR